MALGGAAYAATGSPEAAAGCFAGGFLIDVDHYLDYLLFEKQWRRPGPRSFLSYYFRLSPRKLVLPLHSVELMSILLVVCFFHPWPLLVGYWFGAAMHLIFDVLINGECALKRAFFFYLLSYRAWKRFDADQLIDHVIVSPDAGKRPIHYFFTWRPPEKKVAEAASVSSTESMAG
jgi:hypothetical protein